MPADPKRKYRFQNAEVIYSDLEIVTAAREDMLHLQGLASENPRRRVRLCAHRSPEDSLHEMLIIHERDAYVRPHKHPRKIESMHVISGQVDVVIFDELGTVTRIIEMGDYASGLVFYYRMDRPVFHTLIIRSDVLVFHETTDGPFAAGASVFPDWAPDGSDIVLAKRYIQDLDLHIQSLS